MQPVAALTIASASVVSVSASPAWVPHPAVVAVASVTVPELNATMVSFAGMHAREVSVICIPTSAAVILVVEVIDVLLELTLPVAVVIVAGFVPTSEVPGLPLFPLPAHMPATR